MKKTLKNMIFALGAFISLSSCDYNSNNFVSKVVSKDHEPEKTWISDVRVQQRIGLVYNYYNLSRINYDDEDFIIGVEEIRSKHTTIPGNPHHFDLGWVHPPKKRLFWVNKKTYESLNLNDIFYFNGHNAEISDNIIEKEITKKD